MKSYSYISIDFTKSHFVFHGTVVVCITDKMCNLQFIRRFEVCLPNKRAEGKLHRTLIDLQSFRFASLHLALPDSLTECVLGVR
jgi:hypothetical protein